VLGFTPGVQVATAALAGKVMIVSQDDAVMSGLDVDDEGIVVSGGELGSGRCRGLVFEARPFVEGFRTFCSQPGEDFFVLAFGDDPSGLSWLFEKPKMDTLGLAPDTLCFRDSGRPGAEALGLWIPSSSSSSMMLSSCLLSLTLVSVESVRLPAAFPPLPLIRSIRLPKDEERSCLGLGPEDAGDPRRVA
jgi:hypothetical protein